MKCPGLNGACISLQGASLQRLWGFLLGDVWTLHSGPCHPGIRMKTLAHLSVYKDPSMNMPFEMPILRCAHVEHKKTMSTLAPQDLFTHKHAQTTRQTRWRSRVPTLVTNTRTHLKPIETQAAETPVWVRGGKVVRVRPRLKDECMTDWEIALNHFPAIRIDPSGIHHDN